MADTLPPCKCNIAEPDSAVIYQDTGADHAYWVLRCKHWRNLRSSTICVRTPTLLMPHV
jgi:hypothetical protein